MKKTVRILSIVGGGFLLVGFVLAILSFSLLGFDYKRLDANKTFEQKTDRFDSNTIQVINTNLSNKVVVVKPTSNNQISVTYGQDENNSFVCKQENNTLVLSNPFSDNWLHQIRYGIFYGISQIANQEVTIEVPNNYSGDLMLETSNGAVSISNLEKAKQIQIESSNGPIELNDIKCDTIELKTSNARIELENVNATESIYGKSSNGKVLFNQVTAKLIDLKTSNATIDLTKAIGTNKLSAQSSNGKIIIDEIASNDIFLKTSNSSIRGSVTGKQDEYTIQSDTSNASNNLPNNWGKGPKNLEVDTSNGSIDVEFAE